MKRAIAGEAKPPVLDWIELSRQEELLRFYRTNPGDAPQIIPGRTYYLLAPGQDPREDLVNPGIPLATGCASYRVTDKESGFVIRVMLHKKCFEILNSPPPTAACPNKINAKGILTIGWRGDLKLAWWTVLEVLEQHAVAQAVLANPGSWPRQIQGFWPPTVSASVPPPSLSMGFRPMSRCIHSATQSPKFQ